MDQKQWKKAFPEPPQSFHRKVEATLASLPREKEKNIMRIKKRFTIPVIAFVAIVALGTGLLATGKISSMTGSSSSAPTYTQLPTAAALKEDLGFTPAIPQAFANGYVFENGTVGKESGLDENGNVLEKHKSLACLYKNGGAEIYLNTAKAWSVPHEKDEGGTVVETYNGIELIYSAHTYKFVPADYEMTAQDQADEASGKYIFGFGTDEIEIEEVQGLSWVQEGISYHLLAGDSPLIKADLVTMAKEIIDR